MTLADQIREAVSHGAQVHVWPAQFGGGYHATVRGPHGCRHTAKDGPNPIAVLTAALVEDDRLRRDMERTAGSTPLEAAIVAAADDDFEDLVG